MSAKDGGPAFPQFPTSQDELHNLCQGMSLRDYFAAKAMQAMIGNLPDMAARGTIEQVQEAMRSIHEAAYWHADQMLAERDRDDDG